MSKKQTLQLKTKERQALLALVTSGTHPAREVLRAHILLKSAEGWSDRDIASAFCTSLDTVRRTRRRASQLGSVLALCDQVRTGAPCKLTLEEESRLVALACSPPPAGRQRWTVRLLTTQAIERQLIKPVVSETVRLLLQKTKSSRGRWKVGVRLKSAPSFSRA
jgi:transposase